MIHQSSKIV